MRFLLLTTLLTASCHAQSQSPQTVPPAPTAGGGLQAGPSMEYDPQIVNALLKLLEEKDHTRPANDEFQNPPLKDLMDLGTPAGFHLRNRYIHLGISLAEGLSATEDQRLKDQLLELARWERDHEIRAVALISLATRREAQSLSVFREALDNFDAEIRFAALEALEIWDQAGTKELLLRTIRQDNSSIVRIYAAQALARRGAPEGLETLRRGTDSGPDWLTRAMAVRYLGDLGVGEDYDRALNRISTDVTNDFVQAEAAIAALKLFPKKAPSADQPPQAPPPARTEPPPPPGGAAMNLFVELEPLVITAPRLRIPATLAIDGRVNAVLLRLLEDKADARPKEEDLDDPSVKVLHSLSSPVGFQLNTRYTELGFLLTEGLAGTADLILREKIIRVARQGLNPQVRAAALIAVAYSKEPGDRGLFPEALLSQDVTVRFGALEALLVWSQAGAMTEVGTVARMDLSAPVRAWAAAALLRGGDGAGRDILLRFIDDSHWLARAMAYRYLGELGVPDDFDRILFNLAREPDPFTRSEMCGALLRLHALRTKR